VDLRVSVPVLRTNAADRTPYSVPVPESQTGTATETMIGLESSVRFGPKRRPMRDGRTSPDLPNGWPQTNETSTPGPALRLGTVLYEALVRRYGTLPGFLYQYGVRSTATGISAGGECPLLASSAVRS
jgi:hypothetical protein